MRISRRQKNTGFILLEAKTCCEPSRLLTGFTLLEMIVAIGVFIVVVTVSLSAFLNVHDIQLKMSAFRAASDSVNFAVETMIRDIEEGRCSKQTGLPLTKCTGGSSEIEFYNFDGSDDISYKKSACNLPNPFNHQCIQRRKGGGTWSDITSNDVNITYLNFNVSNSQPDIYDSSNNFVSGDNNQSIITITVEGVSGTKEKLKSKINIQASASMRQLDAVY